MFVIVSFAPEWRNGQTRRTQNLPSRLAIQFIAYPAAFHGSTPPFSTLTFVKPCAWYFADTRLFQSFHFE